MTDLPTLLSAWEALSHTATTGPWHVEAPEHELVKWGAHFIGERPTVEIWADGKHAAGGFYHPVALVADNDTANAAFIAALNPAAVLEMIGQVREMTQWRSMESAPTLANGGSPKDGDLIQMGGWFSGQFRVCTAWYRGPMPASARLGGAAGDDYVPIAVQSTEFITHWLPLPAPPKSSPPEGV